MFHYNDGVWGDEKADIIVDKCLKVLHWALRDRHGFTEPRGGHDS